MTSWVIGNWKLNPASLDDVKTLVNDLIDGVDNQATPMTDCQLIIAPSFVHLMSVSTALKAANSLILLASQDVTSLTESTGAYTGDVSVAQLKDIDVQWTIIGHSERRQYYGEDNQVLLDKLTNCALNDLGAIFCIGETEADYEKRNTEQVLAEQLIVVEEFLTQLGDQVESYIANKLIIAYEPVWAIGTGKVPRVEEVANVHTFIRQRLKSLNTSLAKTPIIYGGSVKPDNAKDFKALESVDGVLVGGAALNAQSFIDIAKSFSD